MKATRRDLNTVMDEVSSHIAEVFTAAMGDINTHYRRIFETLFPGGEGHLELDDPSDPLNSGVEIHARPAGKKVKRLSLLSGGERSLASLALLIAIYMSRPSPFYALDEVEAALDDRNLSRLLQVIGELGERSQLIVVTHQKRTMQIAETLYGVSMRGGVHGAFSADGGAARAAVARRAFPAFKPSHASRPYPRIHPPWRTSHVLGMVMCTPGYCSPPAPGYYRGICANTVHLFAVGVVFRCDQA